MVARSYAVVHGVEQELFTFVAQIGIMTNPFTKMTPLASAAQNLYNINQSFLMCGLLKVSFPKAS